MSRRMSLTIICDHCGRMTQHEIASSSFDQNIYTQHPYPKDWMKVKIIGASKITPPRDYCPTCQPAPSKPHKTQRTD